MNETIFSQIRQEMDDFISKDVPIVEGYSFNQYQTLKRIHLYLNSQFEDSSTYLNREKLFFNVVVPACEVATKMLDVDTKDIRLLPLNPRSQFSTYLLEKELKLWLKTSKFANLLNKISEDVPKYGSVVLEKTKDGANVVDLRKLFLDPSVANIQDSRFVTTVQYMTPSELRKTGWDNVEAAIAHFGEAKGQESYEDQTGTINQITSTPYIKIHKRFGEVPKGWIDGSQSDEMVKALFIVAGVDAAQKTESGETVENGIVLFKSRWYKDWPYKDLHYTRVMGRWMGKGIVESLFDVQVRMNELKNQRRISMEISTVHLFQSKDKSVIRNILTDLDNGSLLHAKSEITPIANEERNLSAFNDEEASYIQQAQRLSFAYDAVSGEASAASTTATAVINAQQQAATTFGFKKENYTNTLRDFFNDLVMPNVLKDLTPEHIMRFTGSSQELAKLDEACAMLEVNDYIKSEAMKGNVVTPMMAEEAKKKALKSYKKYGDSRFVKVKDGYYKDAEFEWDFNIGNEQINPQLIANNTQALIASYNPQAMQDPRFKLLYYKYAESLGISQGEMEMAEQDANDQAEQAPMAPMAPKPMEMAGSMAGGKEMMQ